MFLVLGALRIIVEPTLHVPIWMASAMVSRAHVRVRLRAPRCTMQRQIVLSELVTAWTVVLVRLVALHRHTLDISVLVVLHIIQTSRGMVRGSLVLNVRAI